MAKSRCKSLIGRMLMLAWLVGFGAFGGPLKTFAHGGEDHGDEKPKTETTAAGAVVRTARLGEFELTLKHLPIAPDTPAHATLFVTNYTSNEAASIGDVQIAIDGQNVPLANATVTRSTTPGIYVIDLPAIREGEYTIRVTLSAGGRSSSAAFSGIPVQTGATAAGQTTSWSQMLVMGGSLLFGIALFAALVYLSIKVARRTPISKEAVSA